ncbi:unnamed protein product [Clonostachys solani]|uniref:Guided entry of tail-anchored proteins 1 n=1 Tax=Clonostachys solani TaxID=160281 RepID=A0A9N9Z7B1_9HYPO|nr:unnamed protein product [Clonostachys solani]
MPSSLLVVVFVVEAAVRLINAIGAARINEFLWTAINYLPVPTSKAAAEQRKLQADYLKVRNELNATSSQDEFARWAKLRRQHDKLLEQLEAKSTWRAKFEDWANDIMLTTYLAEKSLEGSRSKFDNIFSALRLVLTKAPQFIIPFWYATEPMFWLPHGWFPYYAEWIISFPRAPLGSVSIASWQLACTGLLTLISDLITGIYGLVYSTSQAQAAPTTKEKSGARKEKPVESQKEK